MARLTLRPRPMLPEPLLMPAVAWRQDGVFTRSQAREDGWSDARQRTLVARGVWVRVVGSVLRHRDVEVGPWQRAWAVWLTRRLLVSHSTAAQLWGLRAPDGFEGTEPSGRRRGPVRAHRLSIVESEVVSAAGLRITSPTRTLTDLLCGLPQIQAVEMATDAFHRGILRGPDLTGAARRARGRTGAPGARSLAISLATEPHSVLEWRFHRRIAELGPGWRFNVEIRDASGAIGIVDVVHEPTKTVIELDGVRFHGPEAFQRDRTRDQRLAASGYLVIRITWADLELREHEVIEMILRTIAFRSRAVA